MSDERKPTPTERLHEVTMAAVSRAPREPECNVDLTLNAKGDVQIYVSARGVPPISLVGAAAEAEFDRLLAKYPRAEPPEGAEALAQARKAAAIQGARARRANAGS